MTLSQPRPSLPAPYIAHGGLDDGIEAALGCVAVPRDALLAHLLVEARHLIRERQDVLVAKHRQARFPNPAGESGQGTSLMGVPAPVLTVQPFHTLWSSSGRSGRTQPPGEPRTRGW